MKASFFFAALAPLCAGPALGQLASPGEGGIVFGHVHLNVSDAEEHRRIWVEHFGGEPLANGAVKFPNMIVALTEARPAAPMRDTVMDHFGFKVRDMARFLERWRADGGEVGREFTGSEGQANAFVTLPDGVYVELQEDQANPREVTGYHIHFYTPGHERLLDWYVGMFDLEVRPRGGIATTTNVPGMNISFAGSEEERRPTRGAALDHIGFEVDGLEAFCGRLAARGVAFDAPCRRDPETGLGTGFFTDPRGARVELTEGLDRL